MEVGLPLSLAALFSLGAVVLCAAAVARKRRARDPGPLRRAMAAGAGMGGLALLTLSLRELA